MTLKKKNLKIPNFIIQSKVINYELLRNQWENLAEKVTLAYDSCGVFCQVIQVTSQQLEHLKITVKSL